MLRDAAEYPNSFVPLGPGEERIETDRYCLCMSVGRLLNTVQRQRLARHEVDEVLEEVRELLRARGRPRTQWEVGSAATPADLVELLLARGLVHDEREPRAVAVALRQPPPPPPEGIISRRVETFEEFRAASEVQFEAFGTPPEELAEQRARLRARWDGAPRIMHGVWLDGELVGAGTCAPTPCGLALFGGATAPRARSRGVYRALIATRWQEATALGTPFLLTQAGAMSRPILERLGFERVGQVEMLLDDFG